MIPAAPCICVGGRFDGREFGSEVLEQTRALPDVRSGAIYVYRLARNIDSAGRVRYVLESRSAAVCAEINQREEK